MRLMAISLFAATLVPLNLRRRALVAGASIAALLCLPLASPVAQADTFKDSYQVAAARTSAPVGYMGETFYTTDFYVGRNAGAGPVTLSGNADGTASFWVDDIAELTITHPDGTTATRSFDDSRGCTATTVLLTPPTDITPLFSSGLNRVHVRFYDTCGGNDAARRFSCPAPAS